MEKWKKYQFNLLKLPKSFSSPRLSLLEWTYPFLANHYNFEIGIFYQQWLYFGVIILFDIFTVGRIEDSGTSYTIMQSSTRFFKKLDSSCTCVSHFYLWSQYFLRDCCILGCIFTIVNRGDLVGFLATFQLWTYCFKLSVEGIWKVTTVFCWGNLNE